MAVALSQGLEAAPHGVMPPRFPVFSKPMTNLRSMGVGSRVIVSEAETIRPRSDRRAFLVHAADRAACQHRRRHGGRRAALVAPRHRRHRPRRHLRLLAHPRRSDAGRSRTGAAPGPRKHLAGYTGMVNFETIGGRIIEAHLRFADQWPDLYGPGWVEALVRLYATANGTIADTNRADGYSVVLFGPHGPAYRHPPCSWSSRSAASPAYPACRSPSMRTRTRRTTPCRPAGSASRSSTPIDLAAGQAAPRTAESEAVYNVIRTYRRMAH